MLKIPQNIQKILNKLISSGYEAYIVGGAVRDSLLGATPEDFDITTSCPPQKIIELFEKTIPTGIKHGTVTVIENSIPTEVTTFRIDGNYLNNRSPDTVKFTRNISEDLKRRDFTINAMAYNEEKGLIDLYSGADDLKNKLIKTVGNPQERFTEDALRILRGIRFAVTLGFNIEENTYNAMLNSSHLLANISGERIFTELSKMLLGENFAILESFINSGGLKAINIINANKIEKIKELPKELHLRFTAFLILTGADFENLSVNLKFSNKLKRDIENLLSVIKNYKTSEKAEIKKILMYIPLDSFEDFITFKQDFYNEDVSLLKTNFENIIKSGEPYKISMLKIDGTDLLKLGICGEMLGKTLDYLLEKCIENPELNKKETLLKIIEN